MLLKDPKRFFKFCLVGGSGVVVNMVVFALVRNTAEGPPSLLLENTAVVLGFVLSCFTNFLLNDRWTWGDRTTDTPLSFFQRLGAYFLVAFVAFGTQLAVFNIMIWLIPPSQWGPYLANLMGIGLGTIINFGLNNLWTFGQSGEGTTSIILRTWRRQIKNMRAGISGVWLLVGCALLIACALALYLAGESTWIAWEEQGNLEAWVRSVAFWFSLIHVLVFAYTTFELLYRSADTRVLTAYPTPPRSWYTLIQVKAWILHAPLLLPGLLFSMPLLALGRSDLFAYLLTYFVSIFILGIPLSLALHLMAGRSILQGASTTKQMLSGGLLSAESAYLFFSPAAAFGVIMTSSVLLEFALRFLYERNQPLPLVFTILGILGGALWSWRRGRQVFEESFTTILPRFRESEVVAPFEEKDLPVRVMGLGLRKWLPTRAAALYTRDLLQLRRRYRLGGFAFVCFAILLGIFGSRAQSTEGLWVDILLLTTCVSIAVFNPAFRLLGPEIERAPLRGALPVDPKDQRLARTAIVALSVLPIVVLGLSVGLLFGVSLQEAVLIGLVGGILSLGISLFSLKWADMAFPRIGPLAWSVRLATLGVLAGAQAIWQIF